MLERLIDIEVSVIVPVGSRQADPVSLYREYKAGLEALHRSYELIFVLDGARENFAAGLRELLAQGERFSVISLARPFGEATALMAGFEHAAGSMIVTLPAYHQIEGAEISKLVEVAESNAVAIGRRSPRAGGIYDRLRRSAYHALVRAITHVDVHDVGCGARAFSRRVLEEVQLYGDQHRFLPVLADRQGFKVQEVLVRQSPQDRFDGYYGPRDHARSLLDVVTIFFLVRFTKKPLRFFGTIGAGTFLVGAAGIAWLVVDRLVYLQALAERPALLLAALIMVLGLQLFALGLLGELIIFTHGRSIKDYQIDRVIRVAPPRESAATRRSAASS